MGERCHTCDRPNCRENRKALADAHFKTWNRFDDDPTPENRLAAKENQDRYFAEVAKCVPVDWRARAIKAEERLEFHRKADDIGAQFVEVSKQVQASRQPAVTIAEDVERRTIERVAEWLMVKVANPELREWLAERLRAGAWKEMP